MKARSEGRKQGFRERESAHHPLVWQLHFTAHSKSLPALLDFDGKTDGKVLPTAAGEEYPNPTPYMIGRGQTRCQQLVLYLVLLRVNIELATANFPGYKLQRFNERPCLVRLHIGLTLPSLADPVSPHQKNKRAG